MKDYACQTMHADSILVHFRVLIWKNSIPIKKKRAIK